LNYLRPEQQTILYAEDEESIRTLVRLTLKRHGYNVLVAENGKMAIEIAKAHDGPIHLLLSDVMMPELDGPNLAEQLRALRPYVRVIFMSGYGAELLSPYSECGFIQKPCLPSTIVRTVGDALALPPKPLRKIVMVILVLDDDPWVSFLTRLILQPSGHTLVEAATAEEAFQRFEETDGQVDLLIADVNLPVSTGIRVGLGLRAFHSRLRIIITSANTPEMWNDQDAAELNELPSDSVAVLQKPFLPENLLDKVARFMLYREYEQERRKMATEVAGKLRLRREWERGLYD
jgi:CheY-like chemotaxis protein